MGRREGRQTAKPMRPMTEAEIEAAARSDPDNRPLTSADFARMKRRGNSLEDLATFMASVEALEKYPFCNRSITTQIQQNFLDAYGVSQSDAAILRVFKMKALLGMFAQGRTVKESALRKKVMWANVMKKFINQAAQRSMSPAAAA